MIDDRMEAYLVPRIATLIGVNLAYSAVAGAAAFDLRGRVAHRQGSSASAHVNSAASITVANVVPPIGTRPSIVRNGARISVSACRPTPSQTAR
jgi:hypothetical protein